MRKVADKVAQRFADKWKSQMAILSDAEFIAETDMAILVEFDDGSSEPVEGVNRFWIPKSVLEPDGEFTEPGDIADLEVRSWFIKKTDGLEEFLDE
jgi:hypothetical protein